MFLESSVWNTNKRKLGGRGIITNRATGSKCNFLWNRNIFLFYAYIQWFSCPECNAFVISIGIYSRLKNKRKNVFWRGEGTHSPGHYKTCYIREDPCFCKMVVWHKHNATLRVASSPRIKNIRSSTGMGERAFKLFPLDQKSSEPQSHPLWRPHNSVWRSKWPGGGIY